MKGGEGGGGGKKKDRFGLEGGQEGRWSSSKQGRCIFLSISFFCILHVSNFLLQIIHGIF